MNRLINTWNRGFSLKNDDLRFIDAAVREALSDLAKGLNVKGAIILWGAEVSVVGTVATVTEGAIFSAALNEIFHVYAHTFVVPNPLTDAPRWCFVTAWDAAGAKTDVDLQQHQAYQIRKAVGSMNDINGQLGYVLFDAITRVPDVNVYDGNITLPVGVTYVNNYSSAKCYKQNGMGSFEMGVLVAAGANPATNSTPLGTLPSGFRPANYLSGLCWGSIGGVNKVMMYTVDINGSIKALAIDGTSLTGASVVLNIGPYKIGS